MLGKTTYVFVTLMFAAGASYGASSRPGLSPNMGDDIAISFGEWMAAEAYCNQPTAPAETALEHYLRWSDTAPSEAARLREKMTQSRIARGREFTEEQAVYCHSRH